MSILGPAGLAWNLCTADRRVDSAKVSLAEAYLIKMSQGCNQSHREQKTQNRHLEVILNKNWLPTPTYLCLSEWDHFSWCHVTSFLVSCEKKSAGIWSENSSNAACEKKSKTNLLRSPELSWSPIWLQNLPLMTESGHRGGRLKTRCCCCWLYCCCCCWCCWCCSRWSSA